MMMTEDSFMNIDFEREKRTGYPEVIYCAGKSPEQSLAIVKKMTEKKLPVFATRVSRPTARIIKNEFSFADYDEVSRTLSINEFIPREGRSGLVAVVSAGTSDFAIAGEAARTAEYFGSNVLSINDVGVAGIHRLFERLPEIQKARVVVAVAGMEGALPSVLAGLVSVPVIAVPTSVGYGAAFGGLSALLGMLTSCAPGISVVNIDNGFGAGYQANLINRG
jgi:NCAIR mutase (PurE)-related protein